MRKFVLAAVLVLMASSAQAATLNVVGGQLMGASGVDVGGMLYDIEFLDGTCIDLYNGCDDVSDFTFQSEADATLASQALLDQVFLDGPSGNFDTDTRITAGCIGLTATPRCEVLTPFAIVSSVEIHTMNAFNNTPPFIDVVLSSPTTHLKTQNLAFYNKINYAVWSPAAPIPEPSTGLLVSTGLLGLAARRRSLRS